MTSPLFKWIITITIVTPIFSPTISNNKIWILPEADGSNGQVLKTDGSGNLSFITVTTDINTTLQTCPRLFPSF